jgi:cytochrome c oxidase assembly protein subunit 15
VLGGVTVLFGLWPPLVMGHFALSAVLVWNAVVLLDRASHDGSPPILTVPTRVRTLSRTLVAAAGLVLLTGTVVTGTGPHGGDERVARLPFLVEDVARIHSLVAWALLGLVVTTLWAVHRSGASARAAASYRRGQVLVLAIVAQGALGYTQYFLGVPPGLVIVHIAGSVTVWVAAIWFHLGLSVHPGPGETSLDEDGSMNVSR